VPRVPPGSSVRTGVRRRSAEHRKPGDPASSVRRPCAVRVRSAHEARGPARRPRSVRPLPTPPHAHAASGATNDTRARPVAASSRSFGHRRRPRRPDGSARGSSVRRLGSPSERAPPGSRRRPPSGPFPPQAERVPACRAAVRLPAGLLDPAGRDRAARERRRRRAISAVLAASVGPAAGMRVAPRRRGHGRCRRSRACRRVATAGRCSGNSLAVRFCPLAAPSPCRRGEGKQPLGRGATQFDPRVAGRRCHGAERPSGRRRSGGGRSRPVPRASAGAPVPGDRHPSPVALAPRKPAGPAS
jgi:hypothetical protein